MIIFLEGLSAVGKTYLTNKLVERNPDFIRFKGSGAVNTGMQQRWQDYNFWMHNIIERMDQLNNYKKVILWDRGLTDAVYSNDEQYRAEILRVSKSHINKAAIFISGASVSEFDDAVKDRDAKEGSDSEDHLLKYKKVMQSFKTVDLNLTLPDYYITEEHISQVEEFIKGQLDEL